MEYAPIARKNYTQKFTKRERVVKNPGALIKEKQKSYFECYKTPLIRFIT